MGMRTKGMVVALAVALAGLPAVAEAGTWLAGVKGWYASWDSAVLKWFEKDIAHGFLDNGLVLEASRGTGSGYLAGPMVGYQSDDGKLSYSLALMLVSSFSQDWSGQAVESGTSTVMALDSDLSIERVDYDFAVNYQLSDRFKLFAGAKYQAVEMEFDLGYDTLMGRREFRYRLDSEVFIPTAGVGAAWPLSPGMTVGGQLGLLYSFPELTLSETTGDTSRNVWPRPAPGLNAEVTLTWRVGAPSLLQFGYRYQVFQLVTRDPVTWERSVSNDETSGLTVSYVYVF